MSWSQALKGMIVVLALALSGASCGGGGGRSSGDGPTATSKSELMLGGAPPGRSDQFVRGTDSALYRRYSEAYTENDYQYLGNNGVTLVSDPAVAAWGAGRADVFVINQNNIIEHGVQTDGAAFSWSTNWGNPSGKPLKGIAASSGRRGLVDVFVVDINTAFQTPAWNRMWHRRWDNGTDSGWQPYNPPNFPSTYGKPAVAAGTFYPDSFDLFVTGWNNITHRNNIYHAFTDFGTTIDGSESLGEPGGAELASDPGAASWSANRIDLLVTDTAGALRHLYTGDLFNWGWNTWPAPLVTASPAVVAMGENKLRIFAHKSSGGSLLQCTWEGADLGCVGRGGVILGGPGASSWGSPWPTSYSTTYNGEWAVEWTNDLNGLAHDATNWYWNNKKNIYLIPLNANYTVYGDWMSSHASASDSNVYLGGGWATTGNHIGSFHFGDADFYNCPSPAKPGCGHLFVPIETTTDTNYGQYIAIFNPAPDYLHPLTIAATAQQMPLQQHFAWLAINPVDGLLYTSTTFDNVSSLQTYSIDANLKLTEGKVIQLKGYDGVTPLTLSDPTPYQGTAAGIQGGAFSPNGHLYLSYGAYNSPSAGNQGVYAFDTDGTLHEKLTFPLSSNLICGPWWQRDEEVEGIDIVDMAAYPASGLTGQIHMIKMNLYCNSDDGLLFHHWKANNSLY